MRAEINSERTAGAGPRLSPRVSAGWALALLVPAPSVGALCSLVLLPGEPLGQAIYAGAKVWMACLPAVWWLWVDRGRWSWSPPARGGFAVAAGLGVAISAAIVGAYLLLGARLIDTDQVRALAAENGLDRLGRFLLLSAYLIFVNSVMEEYVYRWFIFRKCEAFVSGAAAVGGSAAAFTIHHVIVIQAQMGWTMGLIAGAGVFVGGAAWSWLYLRYRSVWPAYVSHAIVDVAVLAVGYMILFG